MVEGRPHPWKVTLEHSTRRSGREDSSLARGRHWGKPPHEIQPVGIFADFKLDELPEQLRFLGWATYRETETAVVTAERPAPIRCSGVLAAFGLVGVRASLL